MGGLEAGGLAFQLGLHSSRARGVEGLGFLLRLHLGEAKQLMHSQARVARLQVV